MERIEPLLLDTIMSRYEVDVPPRGINLGYKLITGNRIYTEAEPYIVSFDTFTTAVSYILGLRGSGKSYKVAKILEDLLAAGYSWIVIDKLSEYHTLRAMSESILVVSGDRQNKAADCFYDDISIDDIVRKTLNENLHVIFQFGNMEEEAIMDLVVEISEKVFSIGLDLKKPCLLVVEEAEYFVPEQGKSKAKKPLKALAFQGRHAGVGLCVVGHRFSKVDKDLISQAEYGFLKKQTLDIDIERSVKYLEQNGINWQSIEMKYLRSHLTTLNYDLSFLIAVNLNMQKELCLLKDLTRQTAHGAVTPVGGAA
jgi:hypothetical protein